jgi:hypothetical protein
MHMCTVQTHSDSETGGQAVGDCKSQFTGEQGICRWWLNDVAAIVIALGPEPTVEVGSHHGDGNHYEEGQGHYCHMAAKDQRVVVGKDLVFAGIDLPVPSPPSLCRADRRLGSGAG